MPIVTKNVAELENKKIDSYQNIAVVNDLDTMLIINDGSLYSIGTQDFMTYVKDHPDITAHFASKKDLVEGLNLKLDDTSASTFLKDVSYNSETGVFTFTKYDNTTLTIDTPLEELVNGGYYKEDTQELVLILIGGQEIKIPVSELIREYTGETSASIQVVISPDNKITANLVGGGVTRTLLSTEIQNSLTAFESNMHNHINKSVIDGITSANVTTWNSKSDFDGNYNSLTGTPKIPTKTSELSNDSNFATNTSVTNVRNIVSVLEKYVPFHNLSSDNQTQFIRDLGFTMENTIIELWDMLPDVAVIPNILNNSNDSKFNKSLPIHSGGVISINRAGGRGYMDFVDFRTNKKYLKSVVDGIWSDWFEIGTSGLIGNTNIVNIGNGTLTGGLSELNKNLKECFQSVSNGKNLVASAITDKGIAADANESFPNLANKIKMITTASLGGKIKYTYHVHGGSCNSQCPGTVSKYNTRWNSNGKYYIFDYMCNSCSFKTEHHRDEPGSYRCNVMSLTCGKNTNTIEKAEIVF